MTKEKISSFQFYSLLFCARLLTLFSYIPAYSEKVLPFDMCAVGVAQLLLELILSLPLLILMKKQPNKGVIDRAGELSTALSRTVSLIYCAVFFYFTLTTLSRLDLFAGTVVFSETEVRFGLFFVTAVCCYGACLGFQALGRSAVLVLVPSAAVVVFVLLTLIKKIDPLNLTPLFYNGAQSFFETLIMSAGRGVELAIPAVMYGNVTGKKRRGLCIWLVAYAVFFVTAFFMQASVMGGFAQTQLFPFHSLAAIGEYSMFRRLDALITVVWLICAFFKLSLLIYLQARLLSNSFTALKPKPAAVGVSVIAALAAFFVSGSIDRFILIDKSLIKIISVALCTAVIPLVFLIFDRRGKQCRKQ